MRSVQRALGKLRGKVRDELADEGVHGFTIGRIAIVSMKRRGRVVKTRWLWQGFGCEAFFFGINVEWHRVGGGFWQRLIGGHGKSSYKCRDVRSSSRSYDSMLEESNPHGKSAQPN